ncbi:UTP--glucose-1-phosphate uridylyltransferase GalU [Thermocrinis minervae]|uniref:UTP--glucose-1-phosphate uridylyltransferase n=1 Tax=Thermocrinis minervae TaxID=381751 RepID=A0A1M6S3U4_9AQUI|nr:UDP-glucose pyrophosphorylase [Thermocrinis minervae]
MVRKAVLPVAGWGTRFLPATKAMPKEMFPLIDKPIIQFIVEECLDADIENIIFVTGRHKRPIEHHFDINADLERFLEKSGKYTLLEEIRQVSRLINPIYVRQKEQLGLGHAVLTAEPVVGNEPFLVALGDIVLRGPSNSTRDIIKVFERLKRSVIAVFEVPYSEVSKYGIVKVEDPSAELSRIVDLVEKPNVDEAPSNLAIVGRYVFTPAIFEKLRKTRPGKGGEIQLTDAIKLLLEEEEVYAFKIKAKVYDTGTPLGYLQTLVDFALHRKDLKDEFFLFLQRIVNSSNLQPDRT